MRVRWENVCEGFGPMPGLWPMASTQAEVAVAAGGCWVQVLTSRTRASGLTRDQFLALEPLAGAKVRICPVF